MSATSDWINRDPRRRAPEFDFGSIWTRENDPHTAWTVTYNTGTGELYAHTRTGTDIEVLGQYPDPQDVADALPDWGRRGRQAGSLDWVRRQTLALQTTPEPDNSDSVYGIVLNTDGTILALRQPQTISDVTIRLGEHLDVATVNTGDRTNRVIMWVDDLGHDKHLPVNAAATQLYNTGWPILGNAVIVTDNQRPLPAMLVRSLVADLDNSNIAVAPIDAHVEHVLDWDERLDDIEANYETEGINFDLDDLELAAIEHDPEPTLKPHPEPHDMTTSDPGATDHDVDQLRFAGETLDIDSRNGIDLDDDTDLDL
jgi:hypothetical protein